MSEPPSRPSGTAPSGLSWKLVLWIVLVVYALVFLLLNNDRVSISFVFFTAETRLIWLILLSMALGAGLALLGPRYWRHRRRSGVDAA